MAFEDQAYQNRKQERSDALLDILNACQRHFEDDDLTVDEMHEAIKQGFERLKRNYDPKEDPQYGDRVSGAFGDLGDVVVKVDFNGYAY